MSTGREKGRTAKDERRLIAAMLDGSAASDDAAPHRGELLLLGGDRHRRIGRLTALPLPPAEGARPEPWRMAAATLFMLGESAVPRRLRRYPTAPLLTALHCGLDCAFTSVAGFFFDAAAGILGVESAAALENLAVRNGPEEPLRWGYSLSSEGELDFLPLLEDLLDVDDAALGAALFHATFAEGVADWIARAGSSYGTRSVALAGDCFGNRVLAGALGARLHRAGYEVRAPFTQRASARAALRGVRTTDLEAQV